MYHNCQSKTVLYCDKNMYSISKLIIQSLLILMEYTDESLKILKYKMKNEQLIYR